MYVRLIDVIRSVVASRYISLYIENNDMFDNQVNRANVK